LQGHAVGVAQGAGIVDGLELRTAGGAGVDEFLRGTGHVTDAGLQDVLLAGHGGRIVGGVVQRVDHAVQGGE
ncbi:hypothetical protein B8W90_13955, partial [Staphylococcus hominis]